MAKVNIDSSGPRLPWAGKKVQIENVEEELSFLWRMTADNVRTSSNINVRTSVLNLMICAANIESAQRASQFMRELLSTHIARFTLLILDDSSNLPAGVSTWVTIRSFPILSDLMRHNFEQVTILLSGSAVQAVSHIVQPLLKPDLPIYLWWLNDPPYGRNVFGDLAQLSSRVIVDSHTFHQPEDGLNFLSSFLQKAPDSAISDLNWGRLTPWRELVAQFFDVPEYLPYLSGVHRIEIEHAVKAENEASGEGETPPDPVQALLLAGWLKTILNWKLVGQGAEHVHDDKTGTFSWPIVRPSSALEAHSISVGNGQTGRITTREDGTISIRPRVQSDMRPGTICLVRLVSDMDNHYAIFSLNRGDDAEHVFTSVELPEGTRSQRTVQVTMSNDEVQLLNDELEIMGHDHLFEDALHEVTELLA